MEEAEVGLNLGSAAASTAMAATPPLRNCRLLGGFSHPLCWSCGARERRPPPAELPREPRHGTPDRLPGGGWRCMPYILLGELAERLASAGLVLNFISYLMEKYHMNQVSAASLISVLSGTASLTPLIGAFLSDAYLGRFWMIIVGSFSNLIASVLLLLTAACRSLRPAAPQQHASHGQLAFLLVALIFTTFASGGLRPCTYAFGADQFHGAGSPDEEKKQIQSYFNWFFVFLSASFVAGSTVLVYVQENAGWVWGFAVPSACVLIAIILLFLGRASFRHVRPTGSAFTGFAQVVVAAFHKRNRDLPLDAGQLYQGAEKEVSDSDLLPHTDRLKWLDHAGIETPDDFNADGSLRNRFRLCTVYQIEQLKAVIGLVPIWLVNMSSITVLSQHGSFSVPQANTMNRHIGRSFQIPAASMSVFSSITLMIWMPIYGNVIVPRARKTTGHPGGIKVLHRIGIGFVLYVIALLVSGVVESRRRNFAREHGFDNNPHQPIPLSVFWLVPQYCLYGLGDSFQTVGQLQFLYDQLPDNMRSMAGALFWVSSGVGHYAGTIILQLVHTFTRTPGHEDWLADNLNQGHLDYFYYLLAVLEFGSFIIYLNVARHYTSNDVDDN